VPQMVFAPVAFLEFLEVHEGVVPGVEEKVLLPALAGARLKLDGERATDSRNSKIATVSSLESVPSHGDNPSK